MGAARYARTLSVALVGLEGTVVEVETDIGSQIPALTVLGLPDASVQESRDRVRSAARNSGTPLSPRRITVNLMPATLPKRGSHFDLAIAVSALAADAATEVTAVQSLDTRVGPRRRLVRRPPFVSPHHSASAAALLGGGSGIPRPGAVSRAHCGVLFLDEAPEFDRGVLDSLRQPLESGVVRIDRALASAAYPARFQLVLAANPCPCGRSAGRGEQCRCTPRERRAYLGKLSGPLLDRVDLRLQVPAVSYAELSDGARGESTAAVAGRVAEARGAQAERLGRHGVRTNAQVSSALLSGPLRSDPRITAGLEREMDRGQLTARGMHRLLRVAWTIADLDGRPAPTADDVDTALYFRSSALA